MDVLDRDYRMGGADNVLAPWSTFIAVAGNLGKCLPRSFAARNCRFAEITTSRVSCLESNNG